MASPNRKGQRCDWVEGAYLCVYPSHHDEPVGGQHAGGDDGEGHVDRAILPQVYRQGVPYPLWRLWGKVEEVLGALGKLGSWGLGSWRIDCLTYIYGREGANSQHP